MNKLVSVSLPLVAGDNGRIVYSISAGDDDNDFAIAQNGTIYTTKLLDRETRSLYNLVVMATDQAKATQQRLSSTVQVRSTYNIWMLAESKSFEEYCLVGCDVWEGRGVCSVLLRKPEGKEPLGKPGHRGESNVGMDLNWVGLGGMDWLDWLRTGQLAGYCERGNEISDSIKCGRLLRWLKKITCIFSVTLTLKMEPAASFDILIIFLQTTRCHKP